MKQFFSGGREKIVVSLFSLSENRERKDETIFQWGEEAIQQQMKILDMVWRMVFDIGCLVKT